MCGGSKSSADSSTKSTQTTESRQQDATGVTGTVIQGQTISLDGYTGGDLERILSSIGDAIISPVLTAAGEGLSAVRGSASESIAASRALSRPDLAAQDSNNKTVIYLVVAMALIGGVVLWRK